MLVSMDVIGVFEKVLRKNGFRDSGPVMGQQGKLYANGKKKIVTIRPLRMPAVMAGDIAETGGYVDPDMMQEHIDKFFESLIKNLEGIAAEGNVPCDLIFQGGGTIPIPPAVRQRLEALGFNIIFLTFGPGDEEVEVERRDTTSMGEYFSRLREEGIEVFPKTMLKRLIHMSYKEA